ncbi:MAG: hypothetical protein KAW12_30070 [Candidatus Aminicenantes bacterium]|nr:hypothetical protein [Candidatus Aminicenantes bacterium]
MKKNDKTKLENLKLYQDVAQFSKKVTALAAKLPPSEQDVLALRLRAGTAAAAGFIVRGFRCRYFHEEMGATQRVPAPRACSFSKLLLSMGKQTIESLEKVIVDLNACFAAGYSGRQETINLKLEAYALISHINRYLSYCSRCLHSSS